MKTLYKALPVIILVLMISACSGPVPEGFNFSEDETTENINTQGFDFTEDDVDQETEFSPDEAQNESNPADEQGDDNPGFVFPDNDLELNQEDSPVLPAEGWSKWLIKHNDGTATCPDITIPIWGLEDETITIKVDVDAAGIEVIGLLDRDFMAFDLINSGPGGSHYLTEYTPDGANAPMRYEITFLNLSDGNLAGTLYGDISGKAEGCDIYRSFQGTLLN